jgi:predicted transcriptional regulator
VEWRRDDALSIGFVVCTPPRKDLSCRTIRSFHMRRSSSPTGAAEMSGAADALAVRFGPLPFSAMRRVMRVLTDTPCSRRTVAEASGFSVERISAILRKLVRAGLAMKVGRGYVRRGTAMPVLQDEAVPLEIGRRILLCLTEPRRARDIARIINRPPSNATARLRHLVRRGLVARVGKGVYDLARADGHYSSMPRPAEQLQAEPAGHAPCQRPGPVAAALAARDA